MKISDAYVVYVIKDDTCKLVSNDLFVSLNDALKYSESIAPETLAREDVEYIVTSKLEVYIKDLKETIENYRDSLAQDAAWEREECSD